MLPEEDCQSQFSVTMVESSLELAVCGGKGAYSVKSIPTMATQERGWFCETECVWERCGERWVFSALLAFFTTVCLLHPLWKILWPCQWWRGSIRIPAGIPVDWIGLAGWLAGSEYQWSLSGIAALSLQLSGNTSTQLHVSDWRFVPANKSVCMK